MKLAIIAPLVSAIREPQRGGSQAFVSDLARGLAGRGHDVHLYAASGSRVPGVEVIDTGIDHEALQATLYRASGETDGCASRVAERAFAGVYDAVREQAYDVVHNHAFDAPAVSLASTARAPVVHTLHLPFDAMIADALRVVARHAGRGVPPRRARGSPRRGRDGLAGRAGGHRCGGRSHREGARALARPVPPARGAPFRSRARSRCTRAALRARVCWRRGGRDRWLSRGTGWRDGWRWSQGLAAGSERRPRKRSRPQVPTSSWPPATSRLSTSSPDGSATR